MQKVLLFPQGFCILNLIKKKKISWAPILFQILEKSEEEAWTLHLGFQYSRGDRNVTDDQPTLSKV